MANGGKRPGSGRKKGGVDTLTKTFREQITSKDVALAMRVLRKCMRQTKSIKEARAASEYLLDQKFGKARQAIEVSGEGGGPIHVTVD